LHTKRTKYISAPTPDGYRQYIQKYRSYVLLSPALFYLMVMCHLDDRSPMADCGRKKPFSIVRQLWIDTSLSFVVVLDTWNINTIPKHRTNGSLLFNSFVSSHFLLPLCLRWHLTIRGIRNKSKIRTEFSFEMERDHCGDVYVDNITETRYGSARFDRILSG
jgi:hypothetical protein